MIRNCLNRYHCRSDIISICWYCCATRNSILDGKLFLYIIFKRACVRADKSKWLYSLGRKYFILEIRWNIRWHVYRTITAGSVAYLTKKKLRWLGSNVGKLSSDRCELRGIARAYVFQCSNCKGGEGFSHIVCSIMWSGVRKVLGSPLEIDFLPFLSTMQTEGRNYLPTPLPTLRHPVDIYVCAYVA